MAVVVVGGNGRGVGKTALICGLVSALPELEWTAVKITSHEHWTVEPIWEESEPGDETDTARYLAAGARRAFLLTVPEARDLNETGLGRVLGEFFRYAGRGRNVVFESNRVLHHVQPDLCLMVAGDCAPKASFENAARLADAMVVHGDAGRAGNLVGEKKTRLQLVFHLAQFEEIPPEMKQWVQERLGRPAS